MKLSQLRQPQNLLLLVVLLLLCVYTVLSSFFALMPSDGEYYKIRLDKTHYAGFGAVAICWLSYFAAPQLFRRVLGLALLLTLFNLLSFLPITLSMGITLGDFPIGVNPLGLLALVGFYFLNRVAANAFIRKYLLPAPTPARAAQLRREAVDQFKQTFARKSNDNLRQIVEERKLVAAALTAAHELLQERETATPPGSTL